jgi:hypothetical protein
MANSKLNKIYDSMKRKCYNQKCERYKDYGGRGITICDEWLNNEHVPGTRNCTKGWVAFKNWALENGYRDGLSIDRIDNNKGYCASNCRWVSSSVQNNNKRNNLMITYKGKTQNLKQWCNELGLKYQRVRDRINKYHWTVERAFETKVNASLRMITYKGKTMSLVDWCRELDLNIHTVESRLYSKHWSIEKVLEKKDNRKRVFEV